MWITFCKMLLNFANSVIKKVAGKAPGKKPRTRNRETKSDTEKTKVPEIEKTKFPTHLHFSFESPTPRKRRSPLEQLGDEDPTLKQIRFLQQQNKELRQQVEYTPAQWAEWEKQQALAQNASLRDAASDAKAEEDWVPIHQQT